MLMYAASVKNYGLEMFSLKKIWFVVKRILKHNCNNRVIFS